MIICQCVNNILPFLKKKSMYPMVVYKYTLNVLRKFSKNQSCQRNCCETLLIR